MGKQEVIMSVGIVLGILFIMVVEYVIITDNMCGTNVITSKAPSNVKILSAEEQKKSMVDAVTK